MKKVKILYLTSSLGSGGAEKQLVELVKFIDKEKYQVFLVFYNNIVHFKEIFTFPHVQTVLIEKKKKVSLSFVIKLIQYIKKNKFDLIHAYMHNVGFWARIAGFFTGVSVITSIRTSNIPAKWYLLEKLMGWIDKLLITNSYTACEEYKEFLPNKNIRVIHNGFDLSITKKYNPPDYWDKKSLKIISIGRISPEKNYECILHALKKIGNKIPFHYSIYGAISSEKYYGELQTYLQKESLKNVKFCGTTNNVFNVLVKSHVLILASILEGFPNAILEALALQIPVIASQISDIPKIVIPHVNGFLFNKYDSTELADRILDFYQLEKDQYVILCQNAGNSISQNFSIKNTVQKTEKIYEELLNNANKD